MQPEVFRQHCWDLVFCCLPFDDRGQKQKVDAAGPKGCRHAGMTAVNGVVARLAMVGGWWVHPNSSGKPPAKRLFSFLPRGVFTLGRFWGAAEKKRKEQTTLPGAPGAGCLASDGAPAIVWLLSAASVSSHTVSSFFARPASMLCLSLTGHHSLAWWKTSWGRWQETQGGGINDRLLPLNPLSHTHTGYFQHGKTRIKTLHFVHTLGNSHVSWNDFGIVCDWVDRRGRGGWERTSLGQSTVFIKFRWCNLQHRAVTLHPPLWDDRLICTREWFADLNYKAWHKSQHPPYAKKCMLVF